MGFLSSLFGIKGSQPKTSTVVQAQKLPEEIAPFVKEILGESQDLYKHEIERGYDPYTGQTIAPLTAEEEAAMAGLSGLVGTTTPFLEEALGTYRGGAEEFTPEVAQEYMSPYQRAVTDIEKREAERTFERDTMPRFEASGVAAGGLSGLGTRAGVQAAELQRNQNLLLADIEAKGQQQAFQDARMGFESQKAREQQMATNVGKIGPAMFQAGLAEQGALQTVGEQKRALGQSALDEAYFRFLEEKQFPQKTLSDYSGMVYANPMSGLTSSTKTSTGTPFVPSTGQQLMGMGLAGLNVFGMAGGFSPGGPSMNKLYGNKAAEGGPVLGRAEGGPIVYRAIGGKLWNDPEAGDPNLPMAEYKENHNGGLSLMMEGDDGEFYTRGGIRQDSLYDPGEVREKEVDVKEVSETITPTNILPSITEPAVAKGPPRNLTPQFSTTSAINPYAPSLTERLGAIGGNVKPEQNITDTGGGGLTYKELVQRNLVPQTQPQIVQTTLGPRQLDFPGHISIPQPEGGGDSRTPYKSYGAERRKGLSKEQGGTWTYPQYNVEVAKEDLARRGDAYPAIDIYEDGFGLRHGGGLSQLANGGPVINAQSGSGNLQFGVNDPKLSWYGRYGTLAQRQRAASLMGAPKATISKSPTILQVPSMSRNTPQLQQFQQARQQATQKANPIDMYGTASPGGGGLTGLPQKASVSPGATIARQGQPRPVGTTAPDSAGGPLSITDTVKQTIQRLGQDYLGDRPSFSKRFADAKASISGEEGFSKTKMTDSFTEYQSATNKLFKRMNAKNKDKRAEFNEADKKASEEFFAAEKKAIQSGNNADIIAGAMDEANQRQIKQGGGTIAQWLTDIMNVGVKGIGTRRKEQGKELRELAKAKYKESRTDRKTNRSEELAEINKQALEESKELVDKYGFTKELANMDRATSTAAYAQIAAC